MYSERLAAGFEWASRLHATQTRKGVETPYLGHLLGVASLLIEYHATEDEVIAGLLHDAVEDCGGSSVLAEILERFGSDVADTVMACSDSVTSSPDEKIDWVVRKRAYVASVVSKSPSACLVTACDKLYNATAIYEDHLLGADLNGNTVWSRFGDKSREQIVAYYSAMVAALDGRVPDPLWQRLDRVVSKLKKFTKRGGRRRWVKQLTSSVQVENVAVTY